MATIQEGLANGMMTIGRDFEGEDDGAIGLPLLTGMILVSLAVVVSSVALVFILVSCTLSALSSVFSKRSGGVWQLSSDLVPPLPTSPHMSEERSGLLSSQVTSAIQKPY